MGGDGLHRTTTRVDDDGRTTVQFHENPQELAAWFRRFQRLSPEEPERKLFKPRKGSNAFLDEKAATASLGPRLNIAIHVVGSRGDVQPFIPIAQFLSQPPYGHRVRICTHPAFKKFVESNGIEFFSIGGDPEALMAYMVKNPGLLPSMESLRAGDVRKRREEMSEILHGVWRSCVEAGDGLGDRITAYEVASSDDLFIADLIIANPPSMAHIHCAEKLGIPLHMVFTMPWSPTQAFHHPLANIKYGEAEASVGNYLSFMMMELLTWQGLGDVINSFRLHTLKLDPISPLWGHQLLHRLHVPYSYLWSETLIPKPRDWGAHLKITGFSFLQLANSYTPPADLTSFLEKGHPPIYIGFGSIVVEDPQKLTDLIFQATRLAGIRAIVSKGWGGLGGPDSIPDNIYLIGDCPHDWLFQHVSCVVHHGGAGTTAAGIAAGRPTVVVPFFGDQPFWGQMLARAGAGPTPVPFAELTAEKLAESIQFALQPEAQIAVANMAEEIAREDGAASTARDFHDRLSIDDLRCDICPERLAVWRHKKTGAHLSNFAASCLLEANVFPGREIKLLRHQHWYVDEGAESPVIGTVAALSSFFVSVGMATKDYSERLKKGPPVPKKERKKSTFGPASGPVELPSKSEVSGVSGRNQNGGAQSKDRPPARPRAIANLTPKQIEKIAIKMAEKSKDLDFGYDPNAPKRRTATWLARHPNVACNHLSPAGPEKDTSRRRRYGYNTRVTGRYVLKLAQAGLQTPVAFFYNVANGCRNFPSYWFDGTPVRRRGEITGLGSGLKVAGQEFVLGLWDAVGGLAMRPYEGVKAEGWGKGLGKGLVRAGGGFGYGIGAAIFALPGYSLKGIEKELSKYHLTKLKAEIHLIRLRQALDEFVAADDAQKEEVLSRWKTLHGT
ncbi:hypothetical protein BX600DRAFT_384295 [Xylariales sp. PMI_506]|nr:hypothetical protein BX600DRAFT_384295 [Xylariales sp. PMI_506]